MKKLSIITAVFILITCFSFSADSAICPAAQKDAEKDANAGVAMMWMGAGCVLGPVAVITGFIYSPPIPESRLMGKTADYVTAYTNCYNEGRRWNQAGFAFFGCGITSMLIFIVWLIAAFNNNSRMMPV